MTILTHTPLAKTLPINHSLYHLTVIEERHVWTIDMKVDQKYITTKTLPQTLPILSSKLPSILHCQCFNDKQLPFSQELCQTELGHLFEHVLLEYLCLSKLEDGYESAEFSGRTSWNWVKEERGNFHIVIGKGQKDSQYFRKAFFQSVSLLNLLLSDTTQQSMRTSVH